MGDRSDKKQSGILRKLLERGSHVNTIFDFVGGPAKWLYDLGGKAIIASITAIAIAVWSYIARLPGPIIAVIAIVSFTVLIWAINGLIWGYGRLLRKRLPKAGDSHSRPRPQEIDPYQEEFHNLKIRLPDLVFGGEALISKKRFFNCEIYGPAFICVKHNFAVLGTKFFGGKAIVRIVSGQEKPAGLIYVANVILHNCVLHDISVIADEKAELKIDF